MSKRVHHGDGEHGMNTTALINCDGAILVGIDFVFLGLRPDWHLPGAGLFQTQLFVSDVNGSRHGDKTRRERN